MGWIVAVVDEVCLPVRRRPCGQSLVNIVCVWSAMVTFVKMTCWNFTFRWKPVCLHYRRCDPWQGPLVLISLSRLSFVQFTQHLLLLFSTYLMCRSSYITLNNIQNIHNTIYLSIYENFFRVGSLMLDQRHDGKLSLSGISNALFWSFPVHCLSTG